VLVIVISSERHSAMAGRGNASEQVFDIYKTYRFSQKTYDSRGGVEGTISATKGMSVMSISDA
jgi:hypothetical protein